MVGNLRWHFWTGWLLARRAIHHYVRPCNNGGEILYRNTSGLSTITQMGSGEFPEKGYRKSAYFCNLNVAEEHNSLQPVEDFNLQADHEELYTIMKSNTEACDVFHWCLWWMFETNDVFYFFQLLWYIISSIIWMVTKYMCLPSSLFLIENKLIEKNSPKLNLLSEFSIQ